MYSELFLDIRYRKAKQKWNSEIIQNKKNYYPVLNLFFWIDCWLYKMQICGPKYRYPLSGDFVKTSKGEMSIERAVRHWNKKANKLRHHLLIFHIEEKYPNIKKEKVKFVVPMLNSEPILILIENIKPAIDLLDSNQEIGIIGIKMLDGQNRFTASFGKFPKPYNFLKLKTLQINLSEINQKISNSQTEYVDVDWISGAFLLTTKEIWNQVNGLDESYFMYVEDVDFNKKVQALDKKSVFIHFHLFMIRLRFP